MLDDFREWLSDNLRYFMLGGAILLVLLVVIFGVKACTGRKNAKQEPQQQTEQKEQAKPEEGQKEDTEEKKETEKKEDASAESQLVPAEDAVSKLIGDYYEALGNKDVDSLRTFVEGLSPSDESRIINASDYIEKYVVKNVYEREGLDENSFVVYAEYEYYCQGFEAAVPALSRFYVQKRADDSCYINGNADNDNAISAYINTLQKSAEVKALSDGVKSENQKTLEENPELKEFLEGLGEDDTSSSKAQTGTMLVANDTCNVRDNPGGDVIGGISEGTKVEKLGETDGWIQIDYEGQTGYIYSELLDEVE